MVDGEEETREVFGDYVSIYNFRQSVEDGVTVPLYYENRIPELQLINADFNADMEQVIEEAGDSLPQAYTDDAYHQQCENVYQHIYDSYYGSGQSIYSKVS